MSLFSFKAPITVISSHSIVLLLSNSWNQCKFTTEAAAIFVSLDHFSLPIPTHLFYTEQLASKALLLKSLLFLVSITLIWPLSIQQKVRQEGIFVSGTNIDNYYCHSISLLIYMHMGGYNTHWAQRPRCQNQFISRIQWHKQFKVVFLFYNYFVNSKYIYRHKNMSLACHL